MSSFCLTILSDIHYAGAAEQGRRGFEHRAVDAPFARLLLRLYRKFIWLEDPTAHSHLLDEFLSRAGEPGFVVANGDYSCDSAFIGVADDAACASAVEGLDKLRARFGERFAATIGDHELGKTTLAGNKGGMRLASWRRTVDDLKLEPAWRREFGRYTLIGVTSTLLALPVYDRDMLPEEIAEWKKLRGEHLVEVRRLFESVAPTQRILLFCHDPTALPFLWEEEAVRSRLQQVEATIIGHLHSNLFLWKSRVLAGMPPLGFLGKSIRRYSMALNRAKLWKPFNVRLCPALTGIELLKDGGFYEVELDLEAKRPAKFDLIRMPRSGTPPPHRLD